MSVENDFFNWYAHNARLINNGGVFALEEYDFQPPLYSLFLALIGGITGNLFAAGKMISIFSSVLTLCCIYFLIRKLFDPTLALLAAAATAANNHFLLHSYYVGTDMMFMALAYITITILITQNQTYKVSILLGSFAGLTYLTRYNGVFLIPLCLLVLYLGPLHSSRAHSKIWRSLCCFLSFSITVLPWHLFLFLREGNFFYNLNHLNMARDLLHPNENNDVYWTFIYPNYNSLMDVVLADPGKFFTGILSNVQSHLENHFDHLLPEHLEALVILGIVFLFLQVAVSNENRKLRGIYPFSIIGYFFLMCLIHFEVRYFLYMIPFYGLALVYGSRQILKKIPAKYLKETAKIVLIFCMILFTGWKAILFQWDYSKLFGVEIVKISNFMSYLVNPADKIISRSKNIAYFIGIGYKHFPMVKNAREILEYARSDGTQFVFFHSSELNVRPYFARFITGHKPVPGFQKILVWKKPRQKAVIHRLGESAGWLAYNRRNFETEEVWREFSAKVSNPNTQQVTLEGLINITQPGKRSLAFSGDNFQIFIDDDLIMSNAGENASFLIKSFNFKKGFHLIRIEFEARSTSVVPPGLFWETPLRGEKGPIPRKNLIITGVNSIASSYGP